ncbi:N-methyl-L-tryptophan oxidase [Cytobacillus purgationiresistens]|uniref:N-methyl-L-tryptophan oxidase n=1 Tax=Cytobacillus purgationiresistens TaxID=863449 RepID=A0ABU0AS81_9BACI|nr:N-methyl-L-tryptophan oxidase [Cytobacillus purgationiresistens]MDQ0272900.1 N-methyl-L-tryptophan oxidase [Cytobacillus purgationiresistens]
MVYDTIIIGAGTMGIAAGYYLSKRGKRVLMLDSHNPPHDKGSHHGDTRIIRFSYGEGENYVPLLLRANELWRDLEKESSESIFLQTGVLNSGKEDSTFIKNVISGSATYNLPLEVLSSEEINKKWKGFSLPETFIGCFESMGGILKTSEIINSYRNLASSNGAEIRSNSKVVSIKPNSDKVVVSTKEQSFEAESLIVAAGAWSKWILEMLDLELPLQPLRKTFGWYEAKNSYEYPNFPCFTFETDNGTFYGFPSINGRGIKVGRHDGGVPVNPDKPLRKFNDKDDLELKKFLNDHMSENDFTLNEGKTCLYTMTTDEDFIIDQHPVFKNIAIAAGFSGHGFKFGSVVGEILSDFISTGQNRFDLSSFKQNRFKKIS